MQRGVAALLTGRVGLLRLRSSGLVQAARLWRQSQPVLHQSAHKHTKALRWQQVLSGASRGSGARTQSEQSRRPSAVAFSREPSTAAAQSGEVPAAAQTAEVPAAAQPAEVLAATQPDDSDAPGCQCPPFEQLGVDSRLVACLRGQDIVEPTEVQAAAIPRVLQGINLAVQCYTGSGKTLAYLLPVLTLAIERAEAEAKAAKAASSGRSRGGGQCGTVQALVVVPSRELGMQIVRVAQSLLPPEARGAVQQCIGGANPHRQAEALKENRPMLVVGTPGRLAEMSREGRLQTHGTGMLVLDEVDQLLSPNFQEDLSRILQHTGKRCVEGRQTVLVSATLTPSVLAACTPWCPDLQAVFVGSQPADAPPAQAAARQPTEAAAAAPEPQWGWDGAGSAGQVSSTEAGLALPPHIEHAHVVTSQRHRVDTLRRCIHAMGAQRALVFMNFQQRLKDTQFKLQASGMKVASLHGDLGKMERQALMRQFRAGDFQALIVSDMAARGLDVEDCDAVFNLELPSNASSYAHRAGRTGRLGRKGSVVSLVTSGEAFVVQKLARRLKIAIPEADMTGGEVKIIADE